MLLELFDALQRVQYDFLEFFMTIHPVQRMTSQKCSLRYDGGTCVSPEGPRRRYLGKPTGSGHLKYILKSE